MEIKPLENNYSEWILAPDEMRPCGECKACCSNMAVVELGKPNYTHCQHECANGCAIYGQHPATCKSFVCLWKLPNWLLQDDDRPDRLGVIFFVRDTGQRKQLELWELWPGAAQGPRIKALLEKIRVEYVVVTPPSWTIIV